MHNFNLPLIITIIINYIKKKIIKLDSFSYSELCFEITNYVCKCNQVPLLWQHSRRLYYKFRFFCQHSIQMAIIKLMSFFFQLVGIHIIIFITISFNKSLLHNDNFNLFEIKTGIDSKPKQNHYFIDRVGRWKTNLGVTF